MCLLDWPICYCSVHRCRWFFPNYNIMVFIILHTRITLTVMKRQNDLDLLKKEKKDFYRRETTSNLYHIPVRTLVHLFFVCYFCHSIVFDDWEGLSVETFDNLDHENLSHSLPVTPLSSFSSYDVRHLSCNQPPRRERRTTDRVPPTVSNWWYIRIWIHLVRQRGPQVPH